MNIKEELTLVAISMTASTLTALELLKDEDEEDSNALLDLCNEVSKFSNKLGKIIDKIEEDPLGSNHAT